MNRDRVGSDVERIASRWGEVAACCKQGVAVRNVGDAEIRERCNSVDCIDRGRAAERVFARVGSNLKGYRRRRGSDCVVVLVENGYSDGRCDGGAGRSRRWLSYKRNAGWDRVEGSVGV